MDRDNTQLLKIAGKFTKEQLLVVCNACGSRPSSKVKAFEDVKFFLTVTKREDLREKAAEKIMNIQRKKDNFDKTKDEHIVALAKRITDDLDPNKPPVDYDEQSNAVKADRTCWNLFKRVFKVACVAVLNPVNDLGVFVKAWKSIDDDGKKKWTKARDNLANFVGADGVDKEINGFGDNKTTVFCPLCYTDRANFVAQHAPRHFPKHESPATKKQLNQFVESVESDGEYAANLYQHFLTFWAMLHSAEKTNENLQLINKVKDFYEQMMKGDKDHKLYFPTQLIAGYDSLPKDKLPNALFRYSGKAAGSIRHFRYSNMVNFTYMFLYFKFRPVEMLHVRLLKSSLIIMAEEMLKFKKMTALYAWEALKVPTKSAAALEQTITMALWHLTERNSCYWNMQITGLKDGPFADVHPINLVFIGLYALHQIVETFSVEAIKNSDQLLNVYDAFKVDEREKFNQKYGIVKSDERDAEIAMLRQTLQNVQLTAEAQGNEAILQILAQANIDTVLNSGAQIDQINEENDDFAP